MFRSRVSLPQAKEVLSTTVVTCARDCFGTPKNDLEQKSVRITELEEELNVHQPGTQLSMSWGISMRGWKHKGRERRELLTDMASKIEMEENCDGRFLLHELTLLD